MATFSSARLKVGNSGGSNYDKAMSIFSNVKANPPPPQTTGKTPDEVKLSLENKRLDKARNATKEAEKEVAAK